MEKNLTVADLNTIIEKRLTLCDKQILKLNEQLSISPYMFAKLIGYKSPDSVYKVIEKKTHFGTKAIFGLKVAYPNLNLNYFSDPSLSPWLDNVNQNVDTTIKILEESLRTLKKIKLR